VRNRAKGNTYATLRLNLAVDAMSAEPFEAESRAPRPDSASRLDPRRVQTTKQLTGTQLTEANLELRKLRDELSAELGAMERLHEFSTKLLLASDLQMVLEQTLTAIIEMQGADFGKVQLFDRKEGGLVIVAQRNFSSPFLERFSLVPDDDCANGRAAKSRSPVIVEDVELDESFAPLRPFARAAGFRAKQSTPLISHRGVLLGVVSTHFRKPGRPSDAEMRLTELYARQATQTIERKRAEEERIQLAAIVETSSDFIGIASLTGTAFFLNPAGRRLIGLRDDEPIPADIREYVVPEDRDRVRDEIIPAVERAGFWDGEIALRHVLTGVGIPVLQHVFYTREPQSGKPLTLATVCRDITRRRRAEQAASRAQQEIAHATRLLSMGELTASIAHEVNQPLAAIVSNGNACIRWFDREAPELSQARSSLDSIIRDANRASEIVRRIRTFANKETMPRSQLDVNEVIREVLGLTNDELRRADVLLKIQLAELLPPVIADRIELQQVVLNLVINSIEAMRAVTDRPRCLAITSAALAPANIEVTVADSGNGVFPAHLPSLFEAFFTTKSQGMGLGLAISRRIIESHGGILGARERTGGGLTITFTLPVSGESVR
jgi:PAS domain S-box-containing protein